MSHSTLGFITEVDVHRMAQYVQIGQIDQLKNEYGRVRNWSPLSYHSGAVKHLMRCVNKQNDSDLFAYVYSHLRYFDQQNVASPSYCTNNGISM